MWSRSLLGTDLYHIIHWFFIYSMLGWLVESAYMSICNRKLTNRGFTRGPICPIYGVGALTVYFILKPFDGNYLALYFFGAVLATALEYVTARIMIRFFGSVWWDYSEKPFNYQGILCLESTIAWGFYTVFLFAFLHRFTEAVVGTYSFRMGKWLGACVIVYFLVDFINSLYEAKKDSLPEHLEAWRETIRNFINRD